MKRETIKEIGKYCVDISKILAGLTIFTPISKNEDIEIYSIIAVIYIAVIGFSLIESGVDDEWSYTNSWLYTWNSRVDSINNFQDSKQYTSTLRKRWKMSSLFIASAGIAFIGVVFALYVHFTTKSKTHHS